MKKSLFISYMGFKGGITSYLDCEIIYSESEIPKITPRKLNEIRNELKQRGGFEGVIFINWKWFEDE